MYADSISQHEVTASGIQKNIHGICERTGLPANINNPEDKVRQAIVIERTPRHASGYAAIWHLELRTQLQFSGGVIGKYHRLRVTGHQSQVRAPISIEIGADHEPLCHVGRARQADLLPYSKVAAGVATVNQQIALHVWNAV